MYKLSDSKIRFGAKLIGLILTYVFIVLLIATGKVVYDIYKSNETPTVVESISETPKQTPVEEKKVIKVAETLTVPYTVQAPLTNWNIHEESCEEAALLMIHYYIDKIPVSTTVIPKDTANEELIKMKNWQVAHYGTEPDLDLTALGRFAKDYYGYTYEVKKNITADDIKQAISEGHPVVVPVMTQGLQNSHYSPGNVYHVVLIKGYDVNGVITNDAGVKEGENYHYTWDVLWKAIDAQTAKMHQGRDMLIVK